jgi:vitamin B12 transporter
MNKSIYIGLLFASTLLAEQIKLDNIVVSATKVTQSLKDITSNVTIITDQELQERRYVTTLDALNSMVGVGFTRNGGLGGLTKVYIRGMGGGRVLVLVDGVRYQDPSNKFGADFSRLMISDIERIELIKGAQSGIWGSDASAGVINIITKDVPKGFSSGINTQIGSFGTKSYGFFASYGADKYSAKLSFDKYDAKGFSAQSPFGSNLEDYEDDGYTNKTINLLLKYNVTDNDKLKFNILNIDSTNNDDGSKVGKHTENIDRAIDTLTNLYSLTYNKKLLNQDISLRYSISDFETDKPDVRKGVRKYNGNSNEIELLDNIKYRKKDFLLLGVSYKIDDVDYLKVNSKKGNFDLDSSAIFMTNTNYFDRFIFTQSLRADDYSNFDSKITGKLGIKYLLNEDISFSSNYGTAYNAPSVMMILNPNGKENQNLEPEDTISFDASVQYKNFCLTYFYNEVENLISYSFKNKQHINIAGKSTFKGAEVSYKMALRDDLFLDFGYTRLLAKDKDSRALRRRIQDNYKFSLDYYRDSLTFNLNGEYVGKRYDGMGNTKRQTGKYFLANFVTNYKMQDNISAYFKVENIFDRYYQIVDGYSTSPRAYYMGFDLKF